MICVIELLPLRNQYPFESLSSVVNLFTDILSTSEREAYSPRHFASNGSIRLTEVVQQQWIELHMCFYILESAHYFLYF